MDELSLPTGAALRSSQTSRPEIPEHSIAAANVWNKKLLERKLHQLIPHADATLCPLYNRLTKLPVGQPGKKGIWPHQKNKNSLNCFYTHQHQKP